MPTDRLSPAAPWPNALALGLQITVCGELRTLRLSGELDLAQRASLEDALARIATGRCTVVLDLRALRFMDTSGVHVALAARDLCSVCGCELRLIPGSAAVQRVFELAGVLDELPFQAEESRLRSGMSVDGSEDGAAPDRLAALGVGRAASLPIHRRHRGQDSACRGLELHSSEGPSGRRIHLTGELDSETAPALEALARRLSADGTGAVTLDLGGLTRIDRIGIRALVFTYAICDGDGFDFRVIPGPPQVRRMIARCRAVDLLPQALIASGLVNDWSDNRERMSDAQHDLPRTEESNDAVELRGR